MKRISAPNRSGQRGDTTIEVLIATAVLSLAIVAMLAVMNAGQAIAFNAIERTRVQSMLTSQAAYLKYARDEFILSGRQPVGGGAQLWDAIVDNYLAAGSDDPAGASVCGTNPIQNAFVLRDRVGTVDVSSIVAYSDSKEVPAGAPTVPGASAADTDDKGGLWIEADRQAPANGRPYIDFYIKACWQPFGSGADQEAKTVVRLYEP